MSASSKSDATEGILSRDQVLAYALPAIPLALPTLVLFVNLPTLYVEEFGLGLTLCGLILMLARIGDLVIDPWVGQWVDRLGARGQQRLLIAGGLFCAPGMLLVIFPIQNGIALSLLGGLSLLYFGWTLIQIPYLALLPGLSRYSFERTRLASWREGLGILGLLLSAALPALFVALGADNLSAFRGLILVSLGLGLILIANLLWRLRWPSDGNQPRSDGPHWRLILHNRAARTLIGCWFTNGLANGIPAVLFPLYLTSVIGLPEQQRNQLILLYFVCAILSLPIWLRLSRQIPRARLWRWGMSVSALCFAPAALLGQGDLWLYLLIVVSTGVLLGADLALPHSIQADITDQHQDQFGHNQTALLFAIWNMSTKLALALAGVIALGLTELSGFDQDSGEPGSLAYLYALLPAALKLLAAANLGRLDRDSGTLGR